MSDGPAHHREAAGDRADPRFRLRVEAGEGRLELAQPLIAGPVRVVSLELSLGRLQGPVDLGGGVARFRHRRTRMLSGRVCIDLSDGAESEPASPTVVAVEGADLMAPAQGAVERALLGIGATVERIGDKLRVVRPMHTLLIEALVVRGWRVPDDRGARLTARFDQGLLWLEASA